MNLDDPANPFTRPRDTPQLAEFVTDIQALGDGEIFALDWPDGAPSPHSFEIRWRFDGARFCAVRAPRTIRWIFATTLVAVSPKGPGWGRYAGRNVARPWPWIRQNADSILRDAHCSATWTDPGSPLVATAQWFQNVVVSTQSRAPAEWAWATVASHFPEAVKTIDRLLFE